jgi:glycosyltransferase involved in cell wall biosynthesis
VPLRADVVKILMLTPFPGIRGPLVKHTPLLVDGLRGVGCTVVTEPWGRHADADSFTSRATTRAADIVRIRRRLRSERFDVMVVKTSHEWTSALRDLPLLVATRSSVPTTVLQYHGGHAELLTAPGNVAFKAVTRLVLSLCDGVMVLSAEEQRQFNEFRRDTRIHVVANPFGGSVVATPARSNDERPPTVLFASRLIAEKGIFDTLTALKVLQGRLECRLVVAGDGPREQDVASRVNELGLADVVDLAGFLSGEDLQNAYRAADVFVLPTYWAEGFPTAITEAMAAGLPIVSTRTRGLADHLEEGVNAVFVPPRSPESIADALELLLRDSALRARMSDANRAKVRDFAPEAVARNYVNALESIVARRPTGK